MRERESICATPNLKLLIPPNHFSPLFPPLLFPTHHLPLIIRRIINVSSTAHLLGDLEAVRDKEDLMLELPGAYQAWPAYGMSITFSLIFPYIALFLTPLLPHSF